MNAPIIFLVVYPPPGGVVTGDAEPPKGNGTQAQEETGTGMVIMSLNTAGRDEECCDDIVAPRAAAWEEERERLLQIEVPFSQNATQTIVDRPSDLAGWTRRKQVRRRSVAGRRHADTIRSA